MCISAPRPEGSPTESLSDEILPEVIETNLADYWLALGANPRGQIHNGDDIRWAYSGGQFFNRVVLARLTPDDANQHIDQVVQSFNRRRAAITWLTGPTTTPSDLGERLERYGFGRLEDWKGMAHRLENLDELPSLPADMQIRNVTDSETRRAWGNVVCTSFELPERACELLLQGLGQSASTGICSWHHNLAYQDGVAVAASTLFISRGVAGIYLVSTVPDARNRGLGTALTCLALRQAHELGCDLAVLHATEAGQRIYERLGFRHYCDIGVYRLAAPVPPWKRVASAVLARVRNRLGSQPDSQMGLVRQQDATDLNNAAQ